MIKTCVFHLPNNSKEMIHKFKLNKILSNSRTSIYENENMRFCIDSKVVRVLLYNGTDNKLLEQVRNYFYGDKYEEL